MGRDGVGNAGTARAAGDVVVCILDLDRPAETSRAVESALAQLPPVTRVLVLENGSRTSNACIVTGRWVGEPRVVVLHSPVNLGFSGGHNLLLGELAALAPACTHVLFLNNDAVLDPGAVAALRTALTDNPVAGIAGARQLRMEDPGIIAADAVAVLPWLMQQRFRNAGRPLSSCPPDAPQLAPFVSGACLMVERDLIRQLGGFDGRFFAYFEDWDLCLRAAALGRSSVHVTAAMVRHTGALTTGRDSAVFHFLMTRNRVLTARRHLPAAVFLFVFLPWFMLWRVLGKCALQVLAGNTAGSRGILLGICWLLCGAKRRTRVWNRAMGPGAWEPERGVQ